MEGHEHEEESIQGSQEINDKQKPALAWASRSTEADNYQAQS